ncbi:MAG: metallophosphoesterase family protein [Anaerolineae bacterium]|nr:metallophosphoesterase family protein [Anaerolineae bacterium]
MTITLGLISDTHCPDRCRVLPPAIFDALTGVDLILHAGDVGTLSVLDELAMIAPVVAVHGNDELEGAPDILPSQQVLFLAGQRLLLFHGHYPDRREERANRQIDDWTPKLARWAYLARAVGASMIVYGHTHIPWTTEVNGVWVINPGAIAAGGHLMRQNLQTVARLTLDEHTPPAITYINLADLSPFSPVVDISAGFAAAITQEPIATAELLTHCDWLWREVFPLAPGPVLDAVRRVMFRCLDGEITLIGIPDMRSEILNAPDIPHEAKARVRARFG